MDKLNEFKELAVKAVSQITLARQFAIDNNLTNTKDFIEFEDLLNYLSVLDPNKELAKLPDKIGVEKRYIYSVTFCDFETLNLYKKEL